VKVTGGVYAERGSNQAVPERFERIRRALLSQGERLCTERAVLVTDFFKHHDDPNEPMVVRKAKALRHILQNKSARIFDDELIVGNVGSHRKSVIMQPELAGAVMCYEILWMGRRRNNPYKVPLKDKFRLLAKVIPYWLSRNMVARAFGWYNPRLFRYLADQLDAKYYLINEGGGIGHFLPGYEAMLKLGIEGFLESLDRDGGDLHAAARIACEGLAAFSARLSEEARRAALKERDLSRREELLEISRICAKVPMKPAGTFHEALQSLWLTHLAVCLEGLNSAVSLGRVDQYLYPFYEADRKAGRMTREKAYELLLCFSAKTTEHMFLLSSGISEYHGGYLVAQAATVGGVDAEGNDAVNDLTWIFLDVMENARLRDPNYMARISVSSDPAYVRRAVEVACRGNAVPGLFSDEAVVKALTAHGYSTAEARDYAIVGCVEPTLPGRSFCSTDAALFNLPMCLLLALNSGRRPGSPFRVGARTPHVRELRSMDDVMGAFKTQVEHMVERLVRDIRVIERANRDFHPTPFSSMLVQGCLESGRDVTAGGARRNSSGIQGVGVADVADSLAAIDEVVFSRRTHSLEEVIEAVLHDFQGYETVRAALASAPKFGNDHGLPERYAGFVVRTFHDALAGYTNTRGGPYIPGFYSSTTHVAFGRRTGALPSGRKAGRPFAASMGCCNGCDRQGPTALLNSVASIDATLCPNGYALNLLIDVGSFSRGEAVDIVGALVQGFFDRKGMEVQLNVLDPALLAEARRHPGRYPGIVVRVAGYCAYFDELPDSVKDEIIARTAIALG